MVSLAPVHLPLNTASNAVIDLTPGNWSQVRLKISKKGRGNIPTMRFDKGLEKYFTFISITFESEFRVTPLCTLLERKATLELELVSANTEIPFGKLDPLKGQLVCTGLVEFVRLLPESSFQGAAADSAIRRLCNEFHPLKSNEAELRPAQV
ncbi:hypothetical protein J6590_032753 [Homalodisca vitripennis]|nr:hypothetical protein J6590_032753 [Homalodisca vitripennis]